LGFIAIATLTACGAHFANTDISDSFRAEQVAKIERNRTTKRQILEWFGQPEGIARNGTSSSRGSVSTEDYFGLFAARQPINDSSIVYHYRNARYSRSETVAGVPLLPVKGAPGIGGTLARSASNEDQHLWILFDERGLVRDYILKDAGER
jgi:hypothetical protein